MPPPSPRLSPSWLPAGLLAAAVLGVMMLLFGRYAWSDWSRPHWLEGDPLEVYARVQIAAEQPAHALLRFTDITRLGAPATADWSAYPVPDRLVFVLTGLLSRVTGLIAAVHLAGLLIATLNALSFYACARWLRWRWEWAAALALVFAFSTYNVRWGITLSFSQVFTLPPLVLLCARATRRGSRWPRLGRWLALAAGLGLWLGLANPYLAFFAGVVAGGALLLGLLRRCPAMRLRPLLVFLGCLAGVFALAHLDRIVALVGAPAGPSLVRSADDVRVYALRPADWVVPPADHRVAAIAAIGRDYFLARERSGEFFYNYLGLAGLLGAGALLVSGARAMARRRWSHADATWGLLWICAFGVAGGVNTWLGAAGLDLFRAGTRIGIYALVWALLALGARASRATRRLPSVVSVAFALACAALAIWEQTPPLAAREPPARNRERWVAMTELTHRLETELPAGARVCQLPAVPFPEAGRTGAMTDYEHFLPFLTSRTLRFSYGQMLPSPWLRWHKHVARLPAADQVAALERAGFAALWIDPRAYPDGAAGLVQGVQALGREEVTVPAALAPLRIFRLRPAAEPQLPDLADPRLHAPWDADAASNGLFAVDGWFPLERDGAARWRWAGAQARLGYWHEGVAREVVLHCRIGGPAGAAVVLRQAGRELWRGPTGTESRAIRVPVSPGFNTFEWTLAGRTFRPGGRDPRELGFMIENLSLSVP